MFLGYLSIILCIFTLFRGAKVQKKYLVDNITMKIWKKIFLFQIIYSITLFAVHFMATDIALFCNRPHTVLQSRRVCSTKSTSLFNKVDEFVNSLDTDHHLIQLISRSV